MNATKEKLLTVIDEINDDVQGVEVFRSEADMILDRNDLLRDEKRKLRRLVRKAKKLKNQDEHDFCGSIIDIALELEFVFPDFAIDILTTLRDYQRGRTRETLNNNQLDIDDLDCLCFYLDAVFREIRRGKLLKYENCKKLKECIKRIEKKPDKNDLIEAMTILENVNIDRLEFFEQTHFLVSENLFYMCLIPETN